MSIPASYKPSVGLIKVASLLAILVLCLFGFALRYHSAFNNVLCMILASFLRFDAQWLFYIYLGVWCACFIVLTFSLTDVLLVGLLLISGFIYAINYETAFRPASALIMLAGVTLGKAAKVLLGQNNQVMTQGRSGISCVTFYFLIGLVMLLAFSSWCHLDMTNNAYHGPRWMGLWDNPNIYGMLMGVGLILAIGLLAASPKSAESAEENIVMDSRGLSVRIILLIAVGMMAVGLLFSYSRGAWLGTSVGLLYLATGYGKFKWRWMLPGVFAVAVVVLFFWSSTPDASPWYVKRMDLARSSAQHRVVAWKAGFEIMRDHPFGVGWNKTVETYQNNYSPKEDGAAAITTNDYLMMGTQLGLPSLICFVVYVGLCFRGNCRMMNEECRIQAACRAGALMLLVAFWFDGGLFTLATASVFWVLLELGTSVLTPDKNRKLSQPEAPN